MNSLSLAERIKRVFVGVLIGAVAGPILGGLLGFLLLSLTWWGQNFIWPDPNPDGILPLASIFGVLIAPIAAGIGAIVGLFVSALPEVFRSRVAAASFGGFIGAFLGFLASIGLFGTDGGDLITIFVGLFTLAFTGFIIGAGVKYVNLRWAFS